MRPSDLALRAPSPTDITLKYWNGRGLMEVPRQLLAIAGKFPGAGYTDVRVGEGATPMDEVKDTLDINLGRMPVCVADGEEIGQGQAIAVYIATTHGLMGSTPGEMGKIMSILEALREVNDAFYKLMPYGSEPTDEKLATFFDESDASDYSGMAVGANRDKRALRWYMGRIEGIVGEGGVAVGSAISLADVMIYNKFAETMTKEEAGPDKKDHQRAPFASFEKMEAALAAHPK